MKPARLLALAATVAALLVALVSPGASSRPAEPVARAAAAGGLVGGAASMDDLLEQFIAALEQRDRAALETLRVNEREYRGWIVPGSVEPGQPLQTPSEEASQYFWEVLNTKSAYFREALLADLGGRRLRIARARFTNGTRLFANHIAHRRLELILEDESGQELEVRTGSVAEVAGRFKFISFIRD